MDPCPFLLRWLRLCPSRRFSSSSCACSLLRSPWWLLLRRHERAGYAPAPGRACRGCCCPGPEVTAAPPHARKVRAKRQVARAVARPKAKPVAAVSRNGSATNGSVALKEFRISFTRELVLEADTIGAAIQKAEGLGAVDIRSIARVA